jgi:polyisoprenoid-binding protein YceI
MSMATATKPEAIPAGTYRLDPVHSSVGFEVKHMISTFRGSFGDYDANLESGDGTVRLEGSAGVASIDARDENLATHLQSPEFFDAERHPQVTFGSDRIEIGEDGSVELDGELSIKGITRPIRATGRLEHIEADMSGSPRVGIGLETVVDRREFGLNWNAPLPKGGFALGNDVKLVVHLELVPEEA